MDLSSVLLVIILCDSAYGSLPQVHIVPNKDPNILFLNFELKGECSTCEPHHDDLVWAIVQDGRTKLLNHSGGFNFTITKTVSMEMHAAVCDNWSVLPVDVLNLAIQISADLDGAALACVSQEHINTSCWDENAFCTATQEFRVLPGPRGPVSMMVHSDTRLDQLRVNTTVIISCTGCLEADGQFVWTLEGDNVTERITVISHLDLDVSLVTDNQSSQCPATWAKSTIKFRADHDINGLQLVCYPYDVWDPSYQRSTFQDQNLYSKTVTMAIKPRTRSSSKHEYLVDAIEWYMLTLLSIAMVAILVLTWTTPGSSYSQAKNSSELEDPWKVLPEAVKSASPGAIWWHGILDVGQQGTENQLETLKKLRFSDESDMQSSVA